MNNQPAYVITLYLAFTMAVIAAGIATAIQLSMRRVHADDKESLAKCFNPHTAIGGMTRMSYRSFSWSFTFYTVALSLMQDVFNPKAREINTLANVFYWIGFLGFYVALAVEFLIENYLLYLAWSILNKRSSEKRKTPDEKEAEDAECPSIGADVMVGQSVYLLGCLGHALARWQSSGHEGTVVTINCLYSLFINLSAACMVVVTFLCSLISMYLRDMPRGHLRIEYAKRSLWIYKLCRGLFTAGAWLLLAGLALMGWGCSQPCDVLGRSCYADVAYVPAVLCGTAFLITIAFVIRLSIASRRVLSHASSQDAVPASDDNTNDELAQKIMAPYQTAASSAALAGSFLMYNIATFDTDVIQAPALVADKFFGLTPWAYLFLWANWATVCSALTVVIMATTMQRKFIEHPPRTTRLQFVQSIKADANIIIILFQISLVAFLVAVASIGLCKYEKQMVEPAMISLLASVLIFALQHHIFRSYKKAESLSLEAEPTTPNSHQLEAYRAAAADDPVHQSVLCQIGDSSAYVIMFAFFSYNGVSFLFRPHAVFASFFLTMMTLTTVLALGVSVMHNSLSLGLTKLNDDARKEWFVFSLRRPIVWSIQSSFFAIASFMLAFLVMGYIKQWTYFPADEDYQQTLSERMGWLQLVTTIGAVSVIAALVPTIRRSGKVIEQQEELDLCEFSWRQSMDEYRIRASATSFQLGNVFYIVLFGAVNESHWLATWAFFAFAVITFGLGVVTVVIATFTLSVFYEFETPEARALLGLRTAHIQTFLTYTYGASLLTWLLHFVFQGLMTGGQAERQTPAIGGAAIVIIILSWVRISCIASTFRRSSHDSVARPSTSATAATTAAATLCSL